MADEAYVSPLAPTIPSDADPASEHEQRELDKMVGRTLGHFRIDARVGHGGMGAVYRAWDTSLHRDVALKVLLGASDASRERFVREARVQASLRHPNVVPIHFVGEQDGVSFLVMDLVDGESLAQRIARDTVVPEAFALDVADAIASALAAGSDAGLVHRDVKPSNILVDKEGRIMLADFGLARNVYVGDAPVSGEPVVALAARLSPTTSGSLTRTGAILGTPAYLAPEQARGEPVDFRADMYALGATLYEAILGQPPFTGDTAAKLLRAHVEQEPLAPRKLLPNLRPPAEALVLRLMAKKPEGRFATYADLRRAIADARLIRRVPARFASRVTALAIDLVPMMLYAVVVMLITRSWAAAWFVSSLSFAALERVWSTPGKTITNMLVVDEHGEQPEWGTMMMRGFLRVFGAVLMAIETDLFGPHGISAPSWVEAVAKLTTLVVWAVALSFKLHERVTATHEVYR